MYNQVAKRRPSLIQSHATNMVCSLQEAVLPVLTNIHHDRELAVLWITMLGDGQIALTTYDTPNQTLESMTAVGVESVHITVVAITTEMMRTRIKTTKTLTMDG